ncbi:MAG: hypothetical protein SCH10_00285 [Nitrosomonadaceae bacterium]|nr:hypothetical protein [Nitrosomonadaceae bacterium]
MGFSIAEMLSGNIVQPRQAPQDNSSAGLGQMLQFLMNSNQQPVAQVAKPEMPSLSELAAISAGRRKEKQQADATEQMRQLIGTRPVMGVDSADPVLANGLPGTGYLRGDMPDREFAARLAANPDPSMAIHGLSMMVEQNKPRTQAQPWTGGVKGDPLMRQQNIFGPNNEVIHVGDPYRAFLDQTSYDKPIIVGSGQDDEGLGGAFPPKSIVQINSHGKVDVVKTAPEKITNTIDTTSGIKTETNNFTGETKTQNPTAEQVKSLGNSRLSNEINKQYDELIGTGFDPSAPITSSTIVKAKLGEAIQGSDNPLISTVGSSLIPDGQKAYNNIKKTWAEKNLRDESGASIAPSEYSTKLRIYWPEPGDSKEEVMRKAERRRVAEGIAGSQAPAGTSKTIQPKIIHTIIKDGLSIHIGEDGKYYVEQ